MAVSSRKKRRRSARRSDRRTNRRKKSPAELPSITQRPWLAGLVIGLAVLLGVAMLLYYPPQERLALGMIEIMIVGLALILCGTLMAVEKALAVTDDALHYRRGLFRRRLVPLRVLESIYLIAIVIGLFRAIFQPRRTWPAVAWILAGVVVIAFAVALNSIVDSR